MNDLVNAGATSETQSMSTLAAGIEAVEQTQEQTQTVETQSDNVGDFQDFIKKSTDQNQNLQTQVDALTKQQSEFVNSQRLEQVNKEIKSAVEIINDNVGGDADMAELFLEKQYASDPDLKKIWDNRATNPEALTKALDLMGKEWASKNQNLIDPQIAENQRALMDSQRTGGTVQQDDLNAQRDNMSDAEFLSHMKRLQS